MTKFRKIGILFAVFFALFIVAGAWYLSSVYTNCRMSDEAFEEIVRCTPDHYLDSGILYADEELTVFYCLNGIFVYDYNEDKLKRMIDVEKLNCAINEQKQNMGTTIHCDGEKIALINYGDEKEKFNNYLVYIKTGLAKKEKEPMLNDTLRSIVQVSWISELDCWRSGMCTYVENEMFYMELDKGDEIAKIKLVASDKNTHDRREFYPFDLK